MPLSANEQKTILQSCINNIKSQSNLMKHDLNDNKLLPALKHCSNFLSELRTNSLAPKQYYEIYMLVFDSLETLSAYLLNTHTARQNAKKNNKENNGSAFLADLYEIVQYSGNIIPRLYMMIVIGTTYMSIEGAPTKDLMKDMIEMCHGVQHPIRGLFLRYYLSQRTKNLLPFGNQADFQETVDFLIANFIEMNKLWVRLQHQGHSSERELRYRERKELKILVGSNLVRLSQIIDDYTGDESYSAVEYYKDRIFPTVTEQIIQCRDHLAQSYLIDVLIQVFPDDFHFATLDKLLNEVFVNLHPMLQKSELVQALIDRFIAYEKFASDISDLSVEEKPVLHNVNIDELFQAFWNFYSKLSELDPDLPAEEHSLLLQSLISLLLTFDPENFTNLDVIYKFAEKNLGNLEENAEKEEMWSNLLIVPVTHFKSIKSLLNLENFYDFYNKLTNKNLQKQISLAIIDKVIALATENQEELLSDVEQIDGIFKYLLVLIKESPSKLDTAKNLGVTKTIKINNGELLVTPEFLEVQEKICKVVQLVESPGDPAKNISNLMHVRKTYLNKNFENIVFTYPTLISKILFKLKIIGYVDLQQQKKKNDETSELQLTSQFKNLSVVINELYQYHQEYSSDLILAFYLNVAVVADQLQLESLCYELFTQCFVVYEENLILSTHQNRNTSNVNPRDSLSGGSLAFESILAIANSLAKTKNLTKDNYEGLITKLTLYASKLLKKNEVTRAILACAHLWNQERKGEENDGKRVLECLQKCLRVADGCLDPFLSVKLFIEILNQSIILNVDSWFTNGVIDLIKTNIENLEDSQDLEVLFKRILVYVENPN
ncbi:Vacuolar protein sorting-associated protein 35 [Candida viswanathii]|uniref:Vacuolar protein sorting-associated protein 35 n=1 Tax=Candida viswanathii TaxID=5486 RepID=A0A367XPC0_9ASCO|nr:Vacuolar protein sorting-associated protein 35 [Candida viswanathii]